MAVDITQIKYEVELIVESGRTYSLTPYLIHLSWEEQAEEIAQRANIGLHNAKTDSTYLADILKLNCQIKIYADCENSRKLLFQGTIWDWKYEKSVNNQLTLTVYDPLIRLQRSKDFRYYPAKMDTKAVINDICSDWGIPLIYEWDTITHEKKSFKAQTVSDMIISLLKEVKAKKGRHYVIYYKDGSLHIRHEGTNSDIYEFKDKNIISTDDRLTMDELITKVRIIGKEDNEGRAPIEDEINGKTEFGIFQEIVIRDSNKTLGETRAEAQTIIDEYGIPKETIRVTAPDLPFLRKGDKVKIGAGNLNSYFFIKGISHDATKRTMNMELSRSG